MPWMRCESEYQSANCCEFWGSSAGPPYHSARPHSHASGCPMYESNPACARRIHSTPAIIHNNRMHVVYPVSYLLTFYQGEALIEYRICRYGTRLNLMSGITVSIAE